MPNSPARAAVSVLLLSGVVLGQSPQDRPTFRSGVQYIEVDVLVTDEDGNAVRGLTQDALTHLEDVIPQPITIFSFIDLPVEPLATRVAADDAIEPELVTNTGDRLMFLIATKHITHLQPLIARR